MLDLICCVYLWHFVFMAGIEHLNLSFQCFRKAGFTLLGILPGLWLCYVSYVVCRRLLKLRLVGPCSRKSNLQAYFRATGWNVIPTETQWSTVGYTTLAQLVQSWEGPYDTRWANTRGLSTPSLPSPSSWSLKIIQGNFLTQNGLNNLEYE